jgi:hypothetical protein
MLSEVASAAGELSRETKPIWSLDQIRPFARVQFAKPAESFLREQQRKRGESEIYDQLQTEIMQFSQMSAIIYYDFSFKSKLTVS